TVAGEKEPGTGANGSSHSLAFGALARDDGEIGKGVGHVTYIIQGTKNFTDFENAKISNYDTDVFKPIFDELTKMSGKTYASTLPKANEQGHVVPVTEQEKIDVSFRVIADHLRTLSFAIADGIQPGNSDRNYTLRRILRRAVKYGRTLDFKEPFFYKLVDVLAAQMGDVFPELRVKKEQIKSVLKIEEEAFNRTLDKGIEIFEGICVNLIAESLFGHEQDWVKRTDLKIGFVVDKTSFPQLVAGAEKQKPGWSLSQLTPVSGEDAFKLYDTFGFPLDLTELLARERGLKVDVDGFTKLMERQKEMAREAGKKNKQVVSVSEIETKAPTKFIGYDNLEADVKVLEVVEMKDKTAVVLDVSTCYAEMGGQIGDAGQIILGANTFPITATTKVGNTWLHFLGGDEAPPVDATVKLVVDAPRRHAIERHHTVTHILHWALHEVVSKDATQKGSSVTPDKLTFDFNSAALTAQQLADIERLVNERIVANDPVSWSEVPYVEAKANNGIMALFGEKYGDLVRVVQIGGQPHKLDGWSMELCGGT
ncbi:MAG: hypothetical protein KC766_39240, partial [Myxococcales bacterium]|nr:hypothetical protein [Myxococcales bacterium]